MSSPSSAFDRLPPQLEWSFIPLLGYAAYVFGASSGWTAALAALTALVVANGWVSSHAADDLYSDLLLFLDIGLLGLYFLMLDSLRRANSHTSASFWFYSAAVFLGYLAWDIVLRERSSDTRRRRRYLQYMTILAVGAPVLVAVGLTARAHPVSQIAGALVWAGVLALWHYDKWRLSHDLGRDG